MIRKVMDDADRRMRKSVDSFEGDLSRVRTGRAHPSLLEHIAVEYYGAETPIGQAASVSVEDARTLTVTAWDVSLVPLIEKAILESDLGLNPSTAGTVIRVPIPALTEERRKSLVKLIKAEAEQAKVAVRNIRRDSISKLKELKKAKEISEDEERAADSEVQKLTDSHIKNVDDIIISKEQEILAI
jgi:ribosome recycling factor